MVKKNSIPDRWRSLTAVGQRVPGSRFIAFKVPLKGATNQRVTQNQKFTPKDLLTNIRNQNEELGLIIDLTNTERYYTTKDLPKSVQYVKLHTAGLKIPDDATIHQFKRVVRRFLFAHEDDDKIIGVHCTTGINRTGYLICRYLIDIEGWRPLHAISAFAQSRSHPIEGAVYIEDLIKGAPRSNVGIDTPPTDEERRALESTEDILWDRPRSILEAANEFGDFDARGRRDRPMDREEFNDDPSGGRGPLPNILGDHDLRLTSQPQGRGYMNDGPGPMHPGERFRRPGPHMEGRFNPEAQNRRDFHGPGPRPLMGIQGNFGPRMNQRPFEGPGMGHEDMDYDLRRGGRPNPPQFDNSFPHPGPSYPHNNPMYNEEEEEEYYDNEYYDNEYYDNEYYEEDYDNEDYDNDGADYDSSAQGAMGDSFRGPPNERMNPNARPMEGPMNDRMRPRDPRFMNDPRNQKRFSGNVQGREGPMNERIPQRNARPMGPPVGERANARQGAFMEGPGNTQFSEDFTSDQINPRDTRGMKSFMNETDFSASEGPMNKRMHPNVGRQMNLPMNERVNQGRPQDGHMPQRDVQGADKPMYGMQMQGSRAVDDSMNNQMYPGASQTLDDPRMYPRNAKSFDGPLNDRGYARDSQAMDNSMNNRMPQRNLHTMDSAQSNQMYPRDPRGMDAPMSDSMQAPEGSINNWMHDRGTTEGPINERMHPHDNKFAMNKPRPVDGPMRQNFPNDAGSFEGRNVNATEGPNRFAPYPPRKPLQTQESMGPPRNDQYNMGHATRWN